MTDSEGKMEQPTIKHPEVTVPFVKHVLSLERVEQLERWLNEASNELGRVDLDQVANAARELRRELEETKKERDQWETRAHLFETSEAELAKLRRERAGATTSGEPK